MLARKKITTAVVTFLWVILPVLIVPFKSGCACITKEVKIYWAFLTREEINQLHGAKDPDKILSSGIKRSLQGTLVGKIDKVKYVGGLALTDWLVHDCPMIEEKSAAQEMSCVSWTENKLIALNKGWIVKFTVQPGGKIDDVNVYKAYGLLSKPVYTSKL